MKLPLNWLEKYITSPGKVEDIAERFTFSGTEVEKIITVPEALSDIVVAQILEILPHPNADRLQLAKVKFGKDKTTDVVCGAPNIAIGQKVPLALPGVTLPSGMKLSVSKIRGVESRGMLCAEDELGLGDDHEGIMVLDSRTPIGTPLPKAIELSKVVFDLDVTPNRADCFSVEGLAREYSALTGKKVKLPKIAKLPPSKKKNIFVTILNKKGCTTYIGCRVSGIIIGPSPIWMQSLLREAGVRPINNVVDVTNFVMIATGQPMHAFDAEKISSKGKIGISVRMAKSGEKILGLDDKTYELDPSIQVIAAAHGPIAIAGVIGGKESSVSESTKEIVFEAANFDGPITRKAAQRLGVRTESSSRFEKGLNPDGIQRAMAYAVELLKETTGGKVEELLIEPAPKEQKLKVVTISYERIIKLIGASISKAKMKQILTALEFKVKDINNDKAQVTVPSFRLDIGIEEDIIEEIVRVYDVNKIPATTLQMQTEIVSENQFQALSKKLKTRMVANGFYEIYLFSFYSDKDRRGDSLSMFCDGRFDHIEVTNPLNPEQQYMRKSILSGVINVIRKNIGTAGDDDVKVFDYRRIYIPQKDSLPDERTIIAGGATFAKNDTEHQLLYMKGVVETLISAANITTEVTLKNLNDRGIVFEIEGVPIAAAYVLSQQQLSQYKLKKSVALFELSATMLNEYGGAQKRYTEFSQFPAVTRDLAIEVDPKILWGDVKKIIKSVSLESSSFVSQYPLEGKKSLAFRMVFRSMKETLRSEEIEKEIEQITALLKEKFSAIIRGKN